MFAKRDHLHRHLCVHSHKCLVICITWKLTIHLTYPIGLFTIWSFRVRYTIRFVNSIKSLEVDVRWQLLGPHLLKGVSEARYLWTGICDQVFVTWYQWPGIYDLVSVTCYLIPGICDLDPTFLSIFLIYGVIYHAFMFGILDQSLHVFQN